MSTLVHGRAADVGMDPTRIELIRERARSWVANGDTPSLVLLVARRGVIVLEEAYGILRPSDNAPLQTNSIFPVMSMTKPVTAAAVMCLVEDGLLSLKHPITDYIGEISTPGAEQILIADLLTHMSGYDDLEVYGHVARRGPKTAEAEPGQHPRTAALIAGAKDAPLHGSPGAAALYSNFGYELLGEVVRRVAGQPFEQFVEQRIFAPFAMEDSALLLAAAQRERRVVRPHGLPGTRANPVAPPIDSTEFDGFPSGAAGLKTTARDIATFAQMLLDGGTYCDRHALSRAAVSAMTTPQIPAGTPGYFAVADPTTGKRVEIPIRGGSFGYGLFISADERTAYMNGSLMSPRTFGHDGFGSCNFWADPETGVIGVYLSVMPRLRGAFYFWRNDHFQDMVHAAIID